MNNINDLDQEEKLLLEKLNIIKEKKAQLEKEVTIEVVEFSVGSGNFGLKVSVFRPDVVDTLRYVPSRFYSETKKINYYNEKFFEEAKTKLESLPNLKWVCPEEIITAITNYRSLPDYSFELDFRKSEVHVKIGPKASNVYVYNIDTWRYNQTSKYMSFALAELYKLPLALETYFKNRSYKISDEVQKLLDEQLKKIKLLEDIHNAKDYPEIKSPFPNHDLTPDQRVAIKFNNATNHRCIIAYDMGKGKTAIAEALAEFGDERVLFVCKASLKTNIKRDIKKFTGKDAIVFAGIEPDSLAVKYLFTDKVQYNIINYDVIGRSVEEKDKFGNVIHEVMKWVEVINLSKFDRIIFDECHYMKNMDSKRSKGGRGLKSPRVSLLSGTVIVNRPQELYPSLNIVAPEVFNNYSAFISNFSDGKNGVKNVKALREILKQYMIVRKNEGLDINRIPYVVELSSVARGLYRKALEGIYISLRSGKQSDITSILAQLMRLKQITADDKVESTVELAETALDQTEKKVIIFSQFKASMSDIAKKLGPTAAVINGDTSDLDKYDLIDKFQDKNSNLKYIVTNIMEGLTLTEAWTVIFNDLWWTPKDHLQAEGRAFGRINDYHAGNSYYVTAEDTIDQMIEALLAEKLKTIKKIIDGVDDEPAIGESVVGAVINQLRLMV